MTEPVYKRRSRDLDSELVSAMDASDVGLRRSLVLMTALGYGTDETLLVVAALSALERVSRVHDEARGEDAEVVEGVLPTWEALA